MRKKQGKKKTYLYVYVRIEDKTTRLSSSILNIESNLDKKCELELARLLFLCLEKLTGITPKWGLITGVRPVKRVNKMLIEGYSREEIEKILEEKYLVKR